MNRNFLPAKIHKSFFVTLFILLIFGAWPLLAFLLFIYIILLIIFRKSAPSLLGKSEVEQGAIFSPVNGKILQIKRDQDHPVFGEGHTVLRVACSWWQEFGVYLPCASEIKDVSFAKEEDIYRFRKQMTSFDDDGANGLCISMINKAGDIFGLQLIKCSLGGRPQVGVLPGDRGKQRANIGYFPFGGTILLYIPENYKIMVSEKDDLVAGMTIIGGE